MKKKISLLLSLLVLMSNVIPVQASTTEANYDVEQQHQLIKISTSNYGLKSYLKEENNAFVYKLQNNTSENIYITNIYDLSNPHQAIIQKQHNRVSDIFENTGKLIAVPFRIAFGTVGLIATAPGSVFYGSCYLLSQDKIYLESIPNTSNKSLNAIKDGAKDLVAVPYSALSLPVRDFIAIREANKFKIAKYPISVKSKQTYYIKVFKPYGNRDNINFVIKSQGKTYLFDNDGAQYELNQETKY